MQNSNKGSMLIIPLIVVLGIVGIVAFSYLNDNSDIVTETETESNAESNIVETAQGNSNLSTLVAAVTAADLVEALSDEDANYTVFAPTNAAFASIQSTVDTLLEPENKSSLQEVLQYHVVDSAVLSTELTDGQIVRTLMGENLKVRIVDGEVYINNAKVVTSDVETSNGVVHVIDSVLVPGAFKNVVGTAIDTDILSTLVAAVTAGELVEALSLESANYTVFAPTNTAFANIQSTVDALLRPENKSSLQNVLQYHVVSSEVFSSELVNGQMIKALNGGTLTVSIENGEVFIVAANSKSKVIAADIKTSNGVVHVIDTVLVP